MQSQEDRERERERERGRSAAWTQYEYHIPGAPDPKSAPSRLSGTCLCLLTTDGPRSPARATRTLCRTTNTVHTPTTHTHRHTNNPPHSHTHTHTQHHVLPLAAVPGIQAGPMVGRGVALRRVLRKGHHKNIVPSMGYKKRGTAGHTSLLRRRGEEQHEERERGGGREVRREGTSLGGGVGGHILVMLLVPSILSATGDPGAVSAWRRDPF